jgi:glycosyltransferase involved in cell wall biosynthesis
MNFEKLPLVSIIIPCFNQGKYLSEALDSVLAQDYENWECFIVNDGSLDNTKEIASIYCDLDSRFKYIYKENAGLSAARNTGIKASTGKYILPLDADDKIAYKYCSLAVSKLEENDQIKIVYCRCQYFGIRSGEYELPDFSLSRILGRNLIFCSAFFRRLDYDLSRIGYNENMKYGLEDWDFWLSLLENGGEVFKLDEILFYYRIRTSSMARSMDREKSIFSRRRIWLNHRNLFANNFLDPLLTYEYINVSNSLEYKIGRIILKPLRQLKYIIQKTVEQFLILFRY